MAKLLPFGLLMDDEGVRWINECKPADTVELGELLIQAYTEGLITPDCSNFNPIPGRNGVYWLTSGDTSQTVVVSRYLPGYPLPATTAISMVISGVYRIVWEEGVEQGMFTKYECQQTYIGGLCPVYVTERGLWYHVQVSGDLRLIETQIDPPRLSLKADPDWLVSMIDEFSTRIEYRGNSRVYQHPSEYWLVMIHNVYVLIDRESVTEIPAQGEPVVCKFADPLKEWRGGIMMSYDGSIWKFVGEMRQIDQAVIKNSRKQPSP